MKPLYALALLPSLVLANGPTVPPQMSTPVTVPEISVAQQQQMQQGQSAVSDQQQAATAINDGNTLTDESRYDAWALALALPTATAGIPGAHICHETSRGWSATIMGRSGGTYLKNACYVQEDCKDMVRLYIALRQPALAVKQMEKCGGIVNAQVVLPEKPASAGSSSHADRVAEQKAQVRSGK